jgi:hypothetical protein
MTGLVGIIQERKMMSMIKKAEQVIVPTKVVV